MVDRILEQECALRQVLSNDRKSVHLIPSWQDIQVLESLKSGLGPVYDFTDILSGENYVTVSAIIPLLNHIYTESLLQREEDTQLTKDIKQKVKDYLQDKYSDPNTISLLNIASFLDPRFKKEYMDEVYKDEIERCIFDEGKAIASKLKESLPTTSQAENTQSATPPPPKKVKLGSLFKKTQDSSSLTVDQMLRSEIDKYLQYPLLDSESHPLEWWKSYHKSFPILSPLARKYLSSCATSSPSERAFSTSGNIVSSKWTCLKPDKVNMMVFLAKNL